MIRTASSFRAKCCFVSKREQPAHRRKLEVEVRRRRPVDRAKAAAAMAAEATVAAAMAAEDEVRAAIMAVAEKAARGDDDSPFSA